MPATRISPEALADLVAGRLGAAAFSRSMSP
jgi:hypothetical protein